MGKKILLFCPPFSNYHFAIKTKLTDLGYEVSLEDGKNYYSQIAQYSTIHFKEKIFSKKIMGIKEDWNKYLLEKYSKMSIDYLFVIKGDFLNENFIMTLRTKNTQAKFILYQWDSLKAFDYTYLIPYFNTCFSFDTNDCAKDSRLIYLPLFYLDEYKVAKTSLKNDLFFCGGNLVITSKVGAIGNDLGLVNFVKAHINKDFYRRRDDILYEIISYNSNYTYDFIIANGKNKYKNIEGFNYISNRISHEELVQKLKHSKVVIDMNTPWQSGLTIRTIETLASNKKLITTNQHIKKEPFFNERNILIFDPLNTKFSIPEEFVYSDFTIIDMSDYSIGSFLQKILQ